MPIIEAIRLALSTIRVQKLKSFFSPIGVLIGVTFLIAVVSIVQGMNRYMQDRFANGLIGVNTFEVRRFPAIDNGNVTEDTWREWLRRPRVNYQEAAFVTHPSTGERVYRSGLHIAHFYRGSYDKTGAAAELRASQTFPSGAFLGDGSELDPAADAELCALADRFTYQWPWHNGDVMILDNLLTGHGRNPFEGTRATEVALLD